MDASGVQFQNIGELFMATSARAQLDPRDRGEAAARGAPRTELTRYPTGVGTATTSSPSMPLKSSGLHV